MSASHKKPRGRGSSPLDPEHRSHSKSAREAANTSRKLLLQSVQHSKPTSKRRLPSQPQPHSTDRRGPAIDKILRCSLQKWMRSKKKENKLKKKHEKQKEKRCRSIKRFNEEVRQYNRENFRTEPIEQPPWGIDQQRLKGYAKRVLDQQKKMLASTTGKAGKRSNKCSHNSPGKADNKSMNSEYFVRTSRAADSIRKKKSKGRPNNPIAR